MSETTTKPDLTQGKSMLQIQPNSSSSNSTSTLALPDSDAQTTIQIESFNAFYGDFQALHDINLDIPQKQVTAFIGPSGCGKSTLLKWCNRMNDIVPIAHANGTLRVGNTNVLARNTDVVNLRRKVGMVFQKANPFPKSIFDNVAYGARLHYRISKSELFDLVEWSLKKAALWDEVKVLSAICFSITILSLIKQM